MPILELLAAAGQRKGPHSKIPCSYIPAANIAPLPKRDPTTHQDTHGQAKGQNSQPHAVDTPLWWRTSLHRPLLHCR